MNFKGLIIIRPFLFINFQMRYFIEYRQVPHGKNEIFSILGLGIGGKGADDVNEIEKIVRKAIENGINFFDLCPLVLI